MSLTEIITKPVLRGTIAALGPWNALFPRGSYRVYPYTPGCAVRADIAGGTTVDTYGMGEFAAGDYALVCTRTAYGSNFLYIPNINKLHAVSSVGTTDDELVLGSAMTADQHDWLLNIEVDATQAYTASSITLYDNPVGDGGAQANKYFVTGSTGHFLGWVEDGQNLVDLLITDSSGSAVAVWPSYPTGPGIVV